MYRVILVDDDELSRALLERYCAGVPDLVLAGSFGDPAEALRFAQHNRFELAALDVVMPGMDGMELARRLRRLNRSLVPVFITSSKEFAFQAYQLDAAGYLLKPFKSGEVHAVLERAKLLSPGAAHKVFVRTFGHFDVFVDGKPLRFSRQKSKEILAYLVDRRGGVATVDQIIAALWEDRAGEPGVRASYQVAFKDLRKDLKAVGMDGLLVSARNPKAVDVEAIECDYYRLLAGDERAMADFCGQYMADYSWAEPTTALCGQLKLHYSEQQG